MSPNLEKAHVNVDDFVVEPVQALQAAQQPPRHLNVAGLVVGHNLLSRARPKPFLCLHAAGGVDVPILCTEPDIGAAGYVLQTAVMQAVKKSEM